jgi:hypothetical protein
MRFTVLFVVVLTVFVSCKDKKVSETSVFSVEKGELVFSDDFERAELGEKYTVLGGDWKIENGVVVSSKAENKNLVLSGVDLPQNAVVELTMWSGSEAVDVKFNLWGDGKVHDHGDGYSFILGGWANRISVISKLHEHEKGRSQDKKTRWKQGEKYKVKVERKGEKIRWYVNGKPYLDYVDNDPLKVKGGYSKLSFGNWRSKVHFDDLKIYKVKGD